MKAVWQGAVVAESAKTLVLEGNHYFPPDSIKAEYLRPRRRRTLCPWKGVARHYGLEVGGVMLRHAAWSYPHPFPWVRSLRDHLAFSSGVEVRPD